MVEVSTIPAPAYRKLTRMKRGVGTMTQLWLGSDHLLHVSSTGYTESYRRFYLRDIQTMLIVYTGRRIYLAATLIGLMLLCIVIANAAGGGLIGFGIVVVLFVALLIWNHLLGAGCKVVVVSAVQQASLSSLCRLPKTRRILAELKPLIEAAQAEHLAVAVVPGEAGSARESGDARSSYITSASVPPPLPPS